jgi:hypothetical protein
MNGFQHGGAILGERSYPVVGVWTGIFGDLPPAWHLFSETGIASLINGERWLAGQASGLLKVA